MSSQRVVVIGIDMGDATLVREWSDNGHLPNMAGLLEKGTWLDLGRDDLQ